MQREFESFTGPAGGLNALAVLRALLQNEVVQKLAAVLCAGEEDPTKRTALYCEFVAVVYQNGGDLGAYLASLVLETENPVARLEAEGKPVPPAMAAALESELATFTALSQIDPLQLANAVAGKGGHGLPGFANTPQNFAALYAAGRRQASTRGYGIFAAYHMFTVGQGATLLPVKNPDPQQLAELTGYGRERSQILLNTQALLKGLPANNILLYGDAGTGKSSTVKALANAYRARGLRLVEVRKNQLYQIPGLMDALAENPLKFILFIDDLSFPADDGDFTALKAILEGNVAARPRNIVVYATSNRRHMVKERFTDRQGDDLHLGDTLEEASSLAARFGLTVTFLKPDKELYAHIVQNLKEEYGLATPLPALLAKAEAHALRYGGRSPRTARQFAQYMKAAEAAGEE